MSGIKRKAIHQHPSTIHNVKSQEHSNNGLLTKYWKVCGGVTRPVQFMKFKIVLHNARYAALSRLLCLLKNLWLASTFGIG